MHDEGHPAYRMPLTFDGDDRFSLGAPPGAAGPFKVPLVFRRVAGPPPEVPEAAAKLVGTWRAALAFDGARAWRLAGLKWEPRAGEVDAAFAGIKEEINRTSVTIRLNADGTAMFTVAEQGARPWRAVARRWRVVRDDGGGRRVRLRLADRVEPKRELELTFTDDDHFVSEPLELTHLPARFPLVFERIAGGEGEANDGGDGGGDDPDARKPGGG